MKKPRKKKGSHRQSNTKVARRKRLERATAAYYRSLSGESLVEEKRLEAAVGTAASRVNLDE